MNVEKKIREKIREKSLRSRLTAVGVVLSLVLGMFVPYFEILPGMAVTLSEFSTPVLVGASESASIPQGAYDMTDDVTSLSISSVTGGSASGTTVTANDGVNEVSFKVNADFSIYDPSHDLIDTHKPYVYLKIPRDQLIIPDLGDLVVDSYDNTTAWKTFLAEQKGITNSTVNGTMTVIPTGDDDYGYVLLKFSDDYLEYLKTTNGIVGGTLAFDATVGRDKSQDGDRTVSVGSQSLKVEFEDKVPSVGKSVSQVGTDDNGCPILQWTLTLNDLYELDNYQIVDKMLSKALSFDCQYGVYNFNNGVLSYDEKFNEYGQFTITYTTRVTAEELQDKTEPFKVTNNVKLTGTDSEDEAEIEINPDSTPHLTKQGTPDYEYDGDRSAEESGKNYIYWRVDATRNYGLSLKNRVIMDSMFSNAELVAVADANNKPLNLSDVFSVAGNEWTIKIDTSHLILTYRTVATDNPTAEENKIYNDVKYKDGSDEKKEYVDYQKNKQHKASKSGNYVAYEDEDGNLVEYVEWKLTIDATINSKSKETINGYTVYDSAFVDGKYEVVSVTARNNNQPVTVDKDQVLVSTETANTVTINSSLPDIDYIEVTYRVKISDSTLIGNRANANGTEEVKASNTYKVEADQPKTETVDVPGYVGKTSVTAKKSWSNNDDPNRSNTTSTLTLQYRIGDDTNWQNYTVYDGTYTDTVTLNATDTWSETIFENLPAYKYDQQGDKRTPIYYRVVETINVPAGTDNLYELNTSYSSSGAKDTTGIKGSAENPTITLTNTWQGVNVSAVKNWKDDEGVARPSAQLQLQKSTDGGTTWTNVRSAVSTGTENGTQIKWDSLPKYENGNEIQYRVVEPNVPTGYTVSISGSGTNWTVTNTYNNMSVSATKNWVGTDSDDDKPDTVVFRLLQATDPNGEWTPYGEDITLNKTDYENSSDKLKWTELPKDDGNGNKYYYKVEEIQTTDEQKEYDVSYSYSNYQSYAYDGSAVVTVTNTWKKANLKVTKEWANDTGYEDKRPDVTFTLMVSTDNGATWSKSTRDDAVVTLKNDKTGNMYLDGDTSKEQNAYTWHALDTADGLLYKVVESYTAGYDTYYNSYNEEPVSVRSTDTNNRTINVRNVSNMIVITVNKAWSGIEPSDAPDEIVVQLQQTTTPDDEASWTKFSDKTIHRYNNVYRSVNWNWMPVKNENGEQIYYRIVELSAKKTEPVYAGDGSSTGATQPVEKIQDYDIEVTFDEYNNVTVTNTWKKLNLSIDKQWEIGTNESAYDSVAMKLQRKIGADGTWVDVDADTVTVTKANGWSLNNAWTDLPRTDENGVSIYYRAVETGYTLTGDTTVHAVAESPDFYSRSDSAGLNVTGSSRVTNTPKHISIGMEKIWGNISYSTKPANITVTLYATINGGASWQKVSDLAATVTDLSGVEGTKTLPSGDSENITTYQWNNLPTKYIDDDNVEHDIVYRIEESEIEGFTVQYSNERITSNETVTITNTELAPYSKQAAEPSKAVATDNGNSPATLVSADMEVIPNGILSSDKLNTVTTKTIEINGEQVECYLFKWRVDLTNNKSNSSTNKMSYVLTDTLNDGSVFYNDYKEYGVTIRTNYSTDDFLLGVYSENGQIKSYSTNLVNVIYNDSNTSAVFTTTDNVSFFTYFTATPKSVVDSAMDELGYYSVKNYIIEKAEKDAGSTPREATLDISGGTDVGYIDKINKTSSDGSGVMTDGKAYYTLEVNSDGKYLSTGNTFSVTDTFHILDYTPKDGEKQEGMDVTLKAELQDPVVYYYDDSGNRQILTTDKYSYSVSEDENGEYTVKEDYSTKFTGDNITLYSGGEIVVLPAKDYAIPEGLVAVLRVNYPDAANKKAAIDTLSLASEGLATVEVLNDDGCFDSSGSLLVQIKFNEGVEAGANTKLIGFWVTADGQRVDVQNRPTVYSATLKKTTDVKDYIVKFTLPDGGHYQVNYTYVLRNADGTDIDSGSIVTIHNESVVHTSGGDKSDESTKTSYDVQQSVVQTYAGQELVVEKVDIGNKSLADLNATFKLAVYNTDGDKWYYASDFPFKVSTVGGHEVTSTSVHSVQIGNLTDADGTIPADAAELLLTGKYTLDIAKDTLYKIIEVKAPTNDTYVSMPYEQGDKTVSGNADNTYYFVYETEEQKLAELKAAAGLDSSVEVKSITVNDSVLSIPNVRLISIGAEKIWEQDPNSATQEVEVAVQLWRSDTMDIADAVLVPNQSQFIDETDRTANYTTSIVSDGAYILRKDSGGKWRQEAIWKGLPDGNEETETPYYYFIKEVAYRIGSDWYIYDSDTNHKDTYNKYVNTNGKIYQENGVDAEYRPAYINDATNSSGMIEVVNSRKLLVKKEWQDVNGNVITDAPTTVIDFTLYGIKSDGTEVEIILPAGSNKLTAPTWEIEVPQNLLSDTYVRYRIKENTELEDYIISDVYALNGTVGVMTLINKDKNPASVNVHVTKTWEDGNDIHDEDDYVLMTLYQYTGTAVVDDAFIKKFVDAGNKGAGVTKVSIADQSNPMRLDGTEDPAWEGYWTNLPFKSNGKKVQYFVVETHQKSGYAATYTIDGNTKYLESRTASVTNAQPGALIIKKQWRDTGSGELISNADYGDVQFQLYRKETTTAVTTTTAETTTTTTVATKAIKGNPSELNEPIKLMALGDSITVGMNASTNFIEQAINTLASDYGYKGKDQWNNDVDLVSRVWGGNDGKLARISRTIREYEGKMGNGVYDNIYAENSSDGQIGKYAPDIVYLMIGTNDVLDGALEAGSKTLNGNPIPDAETRLTELINEIYRQKSDVILFVSTIPEFSEDGTDWHNSNLIGSYNSIVQKVVSAQPANREIVLVDGHSAITVDDLGDGLHPTDAGHQKLGKYVAEQIYNYLQNSNTSTETTTTTTETESTETTTTTVTVESDPISKYGLTETVTNTAEEGEDPPISGGLSEDGIITLNADNKWTVSLTGLDPAYEYFAVEIGDKLDEYTPIYFNNGQSPGSGIPIIVENNVEGEHIKVQAEKVWDYPTGMPVKPPTSITFTLQQYTGRVSGTPEKTYEKTVTAADNWTAEWTDLPASKIYTIAETEVEGWTTLYETLEDETDIDGTEIRKFKVTNAIKTGSLQVVKDWFGDPNVDSVKVNIYRVTEDQLDAANSEDYVPPSYNDVSNGLSSQNRVYSMSRAKFLLNKMNAAQPQALPKPRLNLAAVNGVMAQAVDENGDTYEPLVINLAQQKSENYYNIPDLSGKNVTSISVVFDKGGNRQVWFNFYGDNGLWSGNRDIRIYTDSSTKVDLGSYSSTYKYVRIDYEYYDGATIKELRFYYTPTETLELSADKNGTHYNAIKTNNSELDIGEIVAGDTAIFKAAEPTGNLNWTNVTNDSNVFTISTSDDSATISTKKVNSNTAGKVSASDDTSTLYGKFTIVPLAFSVSTPSEVNEGADITLSANGSNTKFSITSGADCATLNGNVLKGIKPGTVTITANNNGVTVTKEITVNPPNSFNITQDSVILHPGGTTEIDLSTANIVDFGTLPTGIGVIQNGSKATITVDEGTAEGTYTFTGTYGTLTDTCDVKVTSLQISNPIETANISSTYEFSVDSSTIATGSEGITWTVDAPADTVTYSVANGKLILQTLKKLETVTITANDGKGGTDSFTFNIDVTEAQSNVPVGLKNYKPVDSVTITKNGNWISDTLTNLPLTDGQGHKYLYYIEEVSNSNYKVISYDGNGKSLEELNGKIKLTNAAKEKTDGSVELPTSGSTGTKIYYTLGGILLLLSAAGYVTAKRRRWSDG